MHRSEAGWLATRRDDFVAAMCSIWMVGGLFTDGWAHRNQKPETFFSPWHGVLYSGFIASALWLLKVVRGGQSSGHTGRAAIPIGYGFRVIGVAIFGVAGVTDFAWHSIFGIEVNTEALLSPPHLALFTGGLLMAAGSITSSLARESMPTATWRSMGSVIAAVTFVLSTVGFFVMYLSPYDYGHFDRGTFAEIGGNRWLMNQTRSGGVASILIFTLLMTATLMWLTNHIALPPGSLLIVMAVPALLQSALTSFELVHRVSGVVVAGIVAELTWPLVRRRIDHRLTMACWIGGLMTLTWFVMFGAIAAIEGLAWSAEFWSGSSILAGLLAAGLVIATQIDRSVIGGNPNYR
jgi:hypothetical protein